MINENFQGSDKFAKLRKRAQIYLFANPKETVKFSQEDVKKLVHELDTYQVELELQNKDLREAQLELEKSRHRLSDLYDFAPVGYLTISSKGLIVEANLAASEMVGVDRRGLLNQPLFKFLCEADQDIHYKCRKKLLDSKEPQTYSLRMKKLDGSVFHAQLKTVVTPNVDGKDGQFRLNFTDITEQKQLENALKESKEEWEKTFDSMNDIVTLMDKNFCIIRANKKAHEFFEAKSGELKGHYCYELFRDSNVPCADCNIVKAISGEKIHSEKTIEHNKFNKIFQVSFSSVLDSDGKFQRLIHIAKDITEIRALEEKLYQSHKMEAMGTLAGGIAHDFNNILASILGFASLIKEESADSPALKGYVSQILKSGNRAKELVKQILAFSRKKHGQKLETMQPQILIKEILQMLRSSLPSTIEIIGKIDSSCNWILADPTQIHQVVVNLFNNAFQAMENEKGIIYVELSNVVLKEEDLQGETDVSPGNFVEFVVQDNGSGMDKDIIKNIFEPYFTTKEVGKGSGIGLAVVHGIVKNHGGLVRVKSEVAKGSTFRVYFPAKDRIEPIVIPDEEEKLLKGTERILVVDDEEMVVNYMEEFLKLQGYNVTSHTSSVDALNDFVSRPQEFDLVITDQTMPKMTGMELSKKLMEVRYDIPVILCTGYSSIVDEQKAKSIGIKRFAMKPVEMQDLFKIVREVIDEKCP